MLGAAPEGSWQLVFNDGKEDKVLGFSLEEVREARLVPVVDFKGRARKQRPEAAEAGETRLSGGHEE